MGPLITSSTARGQKGGPGPSLVLLEGYEVSDGGGIAFSRAAGKITGIRHDNVTQTGLSERARD